MIFRTIRSVVVRDAWIVMFAHTISSCVSKGDIPVSRFMVILGRYFLGFYGVKERIRITLEATYSGCDAGLHTRF